MTDKASLFSALATAQLTGGSTDDALEGFGASARGEMIENSQLPRIYYKRMEDNALEEVDASGLYEQAGIKILGVAEDKRFYNVELPAGFKIKPDDYYMWSKLVDADGSTRAAIYFKPEDNSPSFISFHPRFSHLVMRPCRAPLLATLSVIFFDAAKGETIIPAFPIFSECSDANGRESFTRAEIEANPAYKAAFDTLSPFQDEFDAAVKGIFNEAFPDAKNEFAYWNQDTSAQLATFETRVKVMIDDWAVTKADEISRLVVR